MRRRYPLNVHPARLRQWTLNACDFPDRQQRAGDMSSVSLRVASAGIEKKRLIADSARA
jgi:hypothetical protein